MKSRLYAAYSPISAPQVCTFNQPFSPHTVVLHVQMRSGFASQFHAISISAHVMQLAAYNTVSDSIRGRFLEHVLDKLRADKFNNY
jgi:hypothetical protein